MDLLYFHYGLPGYHIWKLDDSILFSSSRRSMRAPNPDFEGLTPSISGQDNAARMNRALDYRSIVESRFPGLVDRIRVAIQESENKYEGNSSSESFLWEHTQHTASIACQLAQAEEGDPLLPVIAALFHDAGKFSGGKYHAEETIEEEESAQIAKKLLKESGMRVGDIRTVLAGLKALYNENAKKNAIGAIIHDADFLSKFGALGIAAFFTKSALRRRTLQSTILGYLSKELTYASCLPLNMHTAAGRKMAAKKAAGSIKFFRSLLAELRESRIADLGIRPLRIPNPAARGKFLNIQIVISPACSKCGKNWNFVWTTEKGTKCRKLIVDWDCSHCGHRVETSFCLPEIA